MDRLLDFAPNFAPLAARMRPKNLKDYKGQEHILGEGKSLRISIQNKTPHSMLFWGPPGSGKTTLAEIIAAELDAAVIKLSAVTSGVKEIRATIEQAQIIGQTSGRRTVLFIDEVHRFNKSQQDAFLPFIEDGTIVFIGATTENPSFALNNALLSRLETYILKSLTNSDIVGILNQSIENFDGLGARKLKLNPQTAISIADLSGGDARRALNILELISDLVADYGVLDNLLLDKVAVSSVAHFDKNGDLFYNVLSAIHKSIRGSNPDAALYWFCRLIEGGGDPLTCARRLLAIASEDIGNADPNAMTIAINAWDCFARVGEAEGLRAIAQAVIYLASAPKSNAVYLAFNEALEYARQTKDKDVPLHLRNAPTKLMSSLNYGRDYRYAHNEEHAYAAGQSYFPDGCAKTFYNPTDRGFEKRIKDRLDFLHSLDLKNKDNNE